jgi:hypothetical protein
MLLETQGWFLEDDELELTPEITNVIAAFATDLRGPVYRIFKDQQLPAAHMVQRRVEIRCCRSSGSCGRASTSTGSRASGSTATRPRPSSDALPRPGGRAPPGGGHGMTYRSA